MRPHNKEIGCNKCPINNSNIRYFSTACAKNISTETLKTELEKRDTEIQKLERIKYLQSLRIILQSLLRIINDSQPFLEKKKIEITKVEIVYESPTRYLDSKDYEVWQTRNTRRKKIIKELKEMKLGEIWEWKNKAVMKYLNPPETFEVVYYLDIHKYSEELEIIDKINSRLETIKKELKALDCDSIKQEIKNIQEKIDKLVSKSPVAQCKKQLSTNAFQKIDDKYRCIE